MHPHVTLETGSPFAFSQHFPQKYFPPAHYLRAAAGESSLVRAALGTRAQAAELSQPLSKHAAPSDVI